MTFFLPSVTILVVSNPFSSSYFMNQELPPKFLFQLTVVADGVVHNQSLHTVFVVTTVSSRHL